MGTFVTVHFTAEKYFSFLEMSLNEFCVHSVEISAHSTCLLSKCCVEFIVPGYFMNCSQKNASDTCPVREPQNCDGGSSACLW